jgi:hypothetical protein
MLRLLLAGPGRRRQGLGPFLARHLEAAGAKLAGVVGRDPARTQADAQALVQALGHAVEHGVDAAELLGRLRPDGLLVATPVDAHRRLLQAALAARVPVLCEKPLLLPGELAQAPALLAAFRAAGVPLFEICQWPDALAEAAPLLPELRASPHRSLAMLLSPGQRGRAMVEDSLSHLLSVVQAVVPVDARTRLVAAHWEGRGPQSGRLTLDATLADPFPPLGVRFELVHQPTQPRPAWIELDGGRIERLIDPADYAIRFRRDGRTLAVRDPLARLVYRFVSFLARPSPELVRAESTAIEQRARLFAAILDSHDRE